MIGRSFEARIDFEPAPRSDFIQLHASFDELAIEVLACSLEEFPSDAYGGMDAVDACAPDTPKSLWSWRPTCRRSASRSAAGSAGEDGV